MQKQQSKLDTLSHNVTATIWNIKNLGIHLFLVNSLPYLINKIMPEATNALKLHIKVMQRNNARRG